jgi:hypothetical protein
MLDEATGDEERQLRIELMKAQIDHTRVDMAKLRSEMRWEPYKALAVLLGATAAWAGAILALAAWLSQHLH